MHDICDFPNSYVTFTVVTPEVTNTPRIQLDARAVIADGSGNAEEFFLITPCKSERMYVETGLFQDPNFDFCGIFSRTENVLIRTFAELDPHRTPPHQSPQDNSVYESVDLSIRHLPSPTPLKTNEEVVRATLDNRQIYARTYVSDNSGQRQAMLEYCVKTMNVSEPLQRFQVDTGPLLFPAWNGQAETGTRPVEQFVLAFVVYHSFEGRTEFVLKVPTPIEVGGQTKYVSHYSKIVPMVARHELFAV